METQESLRKKIKNAREIKSLVSTMKALAAANIGQYEKAVASLGGYSHTVALGILAYFRKEKSKKLKEKKKTKKKSEKITYAIVFGSDMGLVGNFNDVLASFVDDTMRGMSGKKEIWAVGERIQYFLSDAGFPISKKFQVPNSVDAITVLVGEILLKALKQHKRNDESEIFIFHNQPKASDGHVSTIQRLLPLDKKWKQGFESLKWPSNRLAQVAGDYTYTLQALIREYLFISLFKACAESLASENASRLGAMQRAEKNCEEILEELGQKAHALRQHTIDEELFDVVSGFEALKAKKI